MKIVDTENILFQKNFKTKEEAIEKMLSKVTKDKIKKDHLFDEIIEREKIENTVIGFNFAIPHTKTDIVQKPYVIFAKLKNMMRWAKDEELVKYIMMVLVPKNNLNIHIDILKNISTKLISNEFREKLENAKNISEISEILNS